MTTLHTESRGHGTLPLTLLHGWSLNLRVFDGLAALLEDRVRCTAVDLPGHGRSGVIDADAWRGPAPPAQLLAALPDEPGVLLGWSLGGLLALQACAARPHRVRALILVATGTRFIAAAPDEAGMPTDTAADFRRRLLADLRSAQRDFLELQVRGAQHGTASLAQLQAALDEHGAADARTLESSLDYLYAADPRPLLPGIRVPVLTIAGQYDRIAHPNAVRALAQALPDARFLEVPRAGHAPFLSHTSLVADAIREFLDTLA